jgi:hypothetical protein
MTRSITDQTPEEIQQVDQELARAAREAQTAPRRYPYRVHFRKSQTSTRSVRIAVEVAARGRADAIRVARWALRDSGGQHFHLHGAAVSDCCAVEELLR